VLSGVTTREIITVLPATISRFERFAIPGAAEIVNVEEIVIPSTSTMAQVTHATRLHL
jgi:hypothetical protein